MPRRPRLRVVVTRSARREIRVETAWWRERGYRAERIATALRAAYLVLSVTPDIGRPTTAEGVRVLALPTIGYRLYFRVDVSEGVVIIRAFWPMSRGEEPDLH